MAALAASRLPVGSSANSRAGRRRERTGKRHALLLAAGQLVRIVATAPAQADPVQPGARCLGRRRRRRRSPAARRHSPRPSCWAAGGRLWNTSETLPRRSRARPSSSRLARSWPNRLTVPPLGCSRPGGHGDQRRLARARGPDQRHTFATAHPVTSRPLRISTGPAADGRVSETSSRTSRSGEGVGHSGSLAVSSGRDDLLNRTRSWPLHFPPVISRRTLLAALSVGAVAPAAWSANGKVVTLLGDSITAGLRPRRRRRPARPAASGAGSG